MTIFRATEAGVCTSAGGLLDIGDRYDPELVDGHLHVEDQAHYDAGRIVVADDRKVVIKDGKNPEIVGKAPVPDKPTASTSAAAQEA